MRKTTTSLDLVTVGGRRMWCVKWPKPGGGRERRHFTSTARKREDDDGYKSAKTFFDAKKIEQQNYGTAGLSFTERERAEYRECAAALKPFGKTLRDAIAFYLPHLQTTNASCTVAALHAELLSIKTADGARERYQGDLKSRFGRFVEDFGSRQVAEITATEVDQWLRGLYDDRSGKPLGAVTRNNYRRILIVAFNFAKKRGYCLANVADTSAKANEVKRAAGILTVPEAAALLSHCDERVLPAVALGLFAGLRPESEGFRLDWSHIDFEDKTINIDPENTKVDSSARYVDMSDNLVAWLLPYRKSRGPVFPYETQYYDLLAAARKAAGITSWPHDALRHSFGSYHYGAHRSAAVTQALMGHTNPRIFFRHYRRPMKQADALPYWNIRPGDSSNIVNIATASAVA